MQLDLFTHGRDVMLRNDAIAALRRRDPAAAADAVAALSKQYPEDGYLAPLKTLCDALARSRERAGHRSIAEALGCMETTVVPSARIAFGAEEASGWLAPLWSALAKAAAGVPYRAESAQAHAAPLFLRAGDWSEAQAQVAAIASWRRIPAPLAWMAEARFGSGGLDAAWCLLVELAWIDAERFGSLARSLDAPELQKLLDDFESGFEADGSEFAWFPAWALIIEPALASFFRQTQPGHGAAPERAARLIMELLRLERQGRHADVVVRRKRLRDLHSGLFSRYMATR